MFDLLMQSLMRGNLIPGFEVNADKDTPNVKISIPKSHPKADKLLALAKELATRKTLDSGIHIDTGPNQAHFEKVFNILKDIVDTDMLLAELNRQQLTKGSRRQTKAVKDALSNPVLSKKILKGVLDGGLGNQLGLPSPRIASTVKALDAGIENDGVIPRNPVEVSTKEQVPGTPETHSQTPGEE